MCGARLDLQAFTTRSTRTCLCRSRMFKARSVVRQNGSLGAEMGWGPANLVLPRGGKPGTTMPSCPRPATTSRPRRHMPRGGGRSVRAGMIGRASRRELPLWPLPAQCSISSASCTADRARNPDARWCARSSRTAILSLSRVVQSECPGCAPWQPTAGSQGCNELHVWRSHGARWHRGARPRLRDRNTQLPELRR